MEGGRGPRSDSGKLAGGFRARPRACPPSCPKGTAGQGPPPRSLTTSWLPGRTVFLLDPSGKGQLDLGLLPLSPPPAVGGRAVSVRPSCHPGHRGALAGRGNRLLGNYGAVPPRSASRQSTGAVVAPSTWAAGTQSSGRHGLRHGQQPPLRRRHRRIWREGQITRDRPRRHRCRSVRCSGRPDRRDRRGSLNPATRTIYWINTAPETISWAFLDGSAGGVLNTSGKVDAYRLALDPVAGRVYWFDRTTKTIRYANTDNSGGGALNIAGATPAEEPTGSRSTRPVDGSIGSTKASVARNNRNSSPSPPSPVRAVAISRSVPPVYDGPTAWPSTRPCRSSTGGTTATRKENESARSDSSGSTASAAESTSPPPRSTVPRTR